jgi:hypothetical protein
MRITPIPSAYQKMGNMTINAANRVEKTRNDKERHHSGGDSKNDKKARTDKKDFTHEADAQNAAEQPHCLIKHDMV